MSDNQYRDLIEESHGMRNDSLFTNREGSDEFSWNGQGSIGGDFEGYMESVKSDRQSLRQSLESVKNELHRQHTKLKEAKIQSDYSLREDIDASMQQISHAKRYIKKALKELDGEVL